MGINELLEQLQHEDIHSAKYRYLVEILADETMTYTEIIAAINTIRNRIDEYYVPQLKMCDNAEATKKIVKKRKRYYGILFVGLLELRLIKDEDSYNKECIKQERELIILRHAIMEWDKVHKKSKEENQMLLCKLDNYIEDNIILNIETTEVVKLQRKRIENNLKAIEVEGKAKEQATSTTIKEDTNPKMDAGSKKIDFYIKEDLRECFVVPFRRSWGGEESTYDSCLIKDIKQLKTAKGIARLAYTIQVGDMLLPMYKEMNFREWHQYFCHCINVKCNNDYKPNELEKTLPRLKNTYSYLFKIIP